MGRRCCVAGCASTSRLPEHHGVTYHSFPLDKNTRSIWIRNTRLNSERQITKSVLVCSRHFRRVDFQPQRSGKYLLKQKVFPTVFPWGKIDTAQVEADMEFLNTSPGTMLKSPTGKQAHLNSKSPNSPVDEDTKATVEATVAQIMAEARANEHTEKMNHKTDTNVSANVPITTFTPGIRLEAQDFDGVWHSVRVVEVDNDDGEVLIKFEKTGKNKSGVVGCEEWIPMDSTRLRQKTLNKPIPVFTLEEKCMARWSGPKKFPGTIKKLLDNDTYEVLFDDGYIKNVRAIHMSKMPNIVETIEQNPSGMSTSPSDKILSPSSNTNLQAERVGLSQESVTKNKNRSPSNKRDWPLLDMSTLDLDSLNLPEIPQDGEWTCHWVNDQPIGREGYLVVGEHRKPTVIVEDWRLPTGWVKHMYQRSNILGKWDVILVSPTGKRFRSKSDLKIYLEEQNLMYNPDIYDFSIHRRRAKDINCYVYTSDYVPIQPKYKSSVFSKLELSTNQVGNNSMSSLPSATCGKAFLETPIADMEPPIELLTTFNENEDKKITQVESEVPKQLLQSNESKSVPTTKLVSPKMVKEKEKSDSKLINSNESPKETNETRDDADYAFIGGLRVKIIDNLFRCPQEGCLKNFRKENHLQIHVKHYHQDLNKLLGSCPKMLELAEKRTHLSENDNNEPTPKNQIPNQQFFAKLHQQDLEQTRSHRRSQGIMIKSQSPDKTHKANNIKSDIEITEDKSETLNNNNLCDGPTTTQSQNKLEMNHVLNDSFEQNKLNEKPYDDSAFPKNMKYSPSTRNIGSRKSSRQRTTRQYLNSTQTTVGQATFSTLMTTVGDTNFVGTTDSEETRHSFNGTPDIKKRKSTQAPITPLSGMGSPMTGDSGSIGSFAAPTTDMETPTAQVSQYIKENGEIIKIVSMRQEEIINCLCGYCEEDGLMIQCELCLCWQHGFCNGIGKESQVPDKYVCYICRNPQYVRDSLRFKHDQDWLYDGKLPVANYYHAERTILNGRNGILKKSHSLTGNLLELNNYMHSLRVKINIANNKYHPKLYLWNKNWDIDLIKSELKRESIGFCTTAAMVKPSEKNNEDNHEHHPKKIKLEPSTLQKLAPNVPQPEAAIDTDKCQQRLLEHIKIQQDLVWSRLKEIEAAIGDLECYDSLDDLKCDDISITRDVLNNYIKDMTIVKEIAKLNTLENTINANREITPTPFTK